jgi:hypothetical protein
MGVRAIQALPFFHHQDWHGHVFPFGNAEHEGTPAPEPPQLGIVVFLQVKSGRLHGHIYEVPSGFNA